MMEKQDSLLVLVRHGRSQANEGAQADDHVNILTRNGLFGTIQAAETLPQGTEFASAYSSPYPRAMQTAMVLLSAMNHGPVHVQTDDRLIEKIWTFEDGVRYMTKEQIADRFGPTAFKDWENDIHARPTPLSESDVEVWHRATAFLNSRAIPALSNGSVLVVSHFFTMRAMVCFLNRRGMHDIPQFDIRNSIPFVYPMSELRARGLLLNAP
jgi:broad specificity phosphatase PhoE